MVLQNARMTSMISPMMQTMKRSTSPFQTRASGGREGGTSLRPTMSAGQYEIELRKRGITGVQLQSLMQEFMRTGNPIMPTQSKPQQRPPSGVSSIPTVDDRIAGVTGGSVSTGALVEETFLQKNKMWLIPTGIGAGLLGLYLITKKR